MAAKSIILDWSETGKTVYCIIRREADDFLLNDADGTFGAAPADPYLSLAEDATIKGRYEVSESRQTWNDGQYTLAVYKQAGGSPAPVSDTIIGTGDMWVLSDAEVALDDYANFKADVSLLALEASVQAIPTNPALDTDYTAARAAKLDNLDAAVSSRLAAASYTAPDNAGIAALPLLSEMEASAVLAKQAKLDFLEKWVLNKLEFTTGGDGTENIKLFDDDGVTVLKTWVWDGAAKSRSAAI